MEKHIEALIVDDEYDAREGLRGMVEKYCPTVRIIGQADGVEAAYSKIIEHKPKLVFLDIRMDDGTAFDLLRKFSSINFRIIFVTAYDEYAIDAIKYSALDYLLKPIRPSLLIEAIGKLEETNRIEKLEEQVQLLLMDKNRRDKLALPTSDGLLFVKISEILRCESDSSYTHFKMADGRNILVTRTMKEYESLLPDAVFFRAHKSHLVNINYISQYVNRDGTYIIMDNGDSVPIARNRKDDFLKLLNG